MYIIKPDLALNYNSWYAVKTQRSSNVQIDPFEDYLPQMLDVT